MSEIYAMILQIIHKITATFLTCILLANNINTILIITDFIINQDIIAKTLCIQKEEQKGCNGKCQLRKELSETNSQDKNQPLQIEQRIELSRFIISTNNMTVERGFVHSKTKHKSYYSQRLKLQLFVSQIEHPPKRIYMYHYS
ncbi:MAG: hypothetical protein HKP48_00255 [Winogradskyella sp.]|uniref:hypothetical protein n=1 Tax=Winogradskyella sp. TaxID=1883156 RepID=UPI00184ACFE6|nr:hypothetical protein [Winogradskyella sp.]MBT8245691.1 hypothetical protein [Winogradskyella sp.]NNK21747.1 hypothetical protein [Winogradskyella sp.]